jgi:hypothetical protein
MNYANKFYNYSKEFAFETTTRVLKWENTNLMLSHPGYTGLKTGITEAAGPCLSASY